MAMRVQSLGLALDAIGLVFLPVPVHIRTPYVQHRLRSCWRPVHPCALQPVLHQMPTRPFDYPARDRIAFGQVLIVTHPLPVLEQIRADLRQRLLLRPLQPPPACPSAAAPAPPPPRPRAARARSAPGQRPPPRHSLPGKTRAPLATAAASRAARPRCRSGCAAAGAPAAPARAL